MALTAAERPTAPPRPAGRRARPGRRTSALVTARRRMFWPMVGPALALYLTFVVGPTGYALWLSFRKDSGFGPSQYVGMKNYTRLFRDPAFRTALTNTMEMLFVVGAATFVLAFALTMVLREMHGRKFVRNVLFFPNVVNGIVFGIMAGFLFNADGLVNALLRTVFGVDDPPKWMSSDNMMTMVMATMIWISTGYYTTIIMAGVDRIPNDLYEDCDLAGANAWQRLRHVTIPLTWDVFAVCAMLWTISTVQIFQLILVFGGNSGQSLPSVRLWSVAVYTYGSAFGNGVPEYGMACASAITSLAMVTVVVLLLRRILDRERLEF
jgi:raffinose/stachyose/melibiose transport system permease protein